MHYKIGFHHSVVKRHSKGWNMITALAMRVVPLPVANIVKSAQGCDTVAGTCASSLSKCVHIAIMYICVYLAQVLYVSLCLNNQGTTSPPLGLCPSTHVHTDIHLLL